MTKKIKEKQYIAVYEHDADTYFGPGERNDVIAQVIENCDICDNNLEDYTSYELSGTYLKLVKKNNFEIIERKMA